jgi:hypothetical protein
MLATIAVTALMVFHAPVAAVRPAINDCAAGAPAPTGACERANLHLAG